MKYFAMSAFPPSVTVTGVCVGGGGLLKSNKVCMLVFLRFWHFHGCKGANVITQLLKFNFNIKNGCDKKLSKPEELFLEFELNGAQHCKLF